jgi:hypothetical protein
MAMSKVIRTTLITRCFIPLPPELTPPENRFTETVKCAAGGFTTPSIPVIKQIRKTGNAREFSEFLE